jgi:adenylylsulfate kinase
VSPGHHCLSLNELNLHLIRLDGGTQNRIALCEEIVAEYADMMKAGAEFPPIRVWFDGSNYWLVDGFHRLAAAKRSGLAALPAQALSGTLEEAQWDSYSANAIHGLRRTPADIESVVTRALNHPLRRALSNNQIARHLHLPEATLRRWKKRLSSSLDEDATRVAVRNGKTYSIHTERIGRHQTNDLPARSRTALKEDLENLKTDAAPDARRVINIFTHWTRGTADARSVVSAIERVVASLGRSGSTGRPGLTVWLTGMSSAGKSTISKALYGQLRTLYGNVEWLDGDAVREHLSKGLGFSRADRDENVRRIGFVAERLTRNGVVTLVSAISPFRATRDEVRAHIENFIEVYVNAPLLVCEQRDLKGVYKRGRSGELEEVTGLDSPYEAPLSPEVECRTDLETPAQSAAKVLKAIQKCLASAHAAIA